MTEYIKREAAIRVICDCCAVCADIECCDYAKGSYGGCKEIEGLRAIPAADVVEVVRCKDCGFWYVPKLEKGEKLGACGWWSGNANIRATRAEDYCSRGVRKEGEE